GTFWLSSAGALVPGSAGAPQVAAAIAQEWASAEGAGRPTGELFGPVRYGSQWLVAARGQIPRRPPPSPATAPLLSVSYESLDALLAGAGFGTLVSEGYDFQLSQPDPATGRTRVFLASRPAPLEAPAVGTAYAPPGPAGRGRAFLTLAVRPKSGWYP